MRKDTGISLYWKLQIIGWLVTSFYWAFTSFFEGNFIWKLGVADFALDVFVGISLTHFYRLFALKSGWDKLDLKRLVPRIALAILVLSVSYMFLIVGKLYLVRWLLIDDLTVSFADFFRSTRLQVFITGTRLMSIWVLAYHLYHYSKREIEIAKENFRLSLLVKEAQLNNLSSQLNPHFFFNSLNNIKCLIAEKPDSARRAIDLLSELMRNALGDRKDGLVPLDSEISLVGDYLELEKMRYEDRLQSTMTIDRGLEDVLIPPLSIQTLVENAVKHGLEKRKTGGSIDIKIEREDNVVRISVQNSGVLVDNDHNRGIGLRNLCERLAIQFDGKASFTIEQLNEETVLATIVIPSK